MITTNVNSKVRDLNTSNTKSNALDSNSKVTDDLELFVLSGGEGYELMRFCYGMFLFYNFIYSM